MTSFYPKKAARLVLLPFLFLPIYLNAQTCDCTEFIYLNEPSDGSVHKYSVAANGDLTEVGGQDGIPWYPGVSGSSETPNPHGLVQDINGNLYIGENSGGDVRQFDCEGNIRPESTFVITDGGNSYATDGIFIFFHSRSSQTLVRYNLCDAVGSALNTADGELCLEDSDDGRSWGVKRFEDGRFLVTATFLNGNTNEVYLFTPVESDWQNQTCFDPIIREADGVLSGDDYDIWDATLDPDDNLYVIYVDENPFQNSPPTSIQKWVPNGGGGYTLDATISDDVINDGNGGFNRAAGIVYSETSELLYVSTTSRFDDCISIIDPVTFTYVREAVPSPGDNSNSKGMAINIECCPPAGNSTIAANLCGENLMQGEILFLNEFTGCEGGICQGVWTPQGALVDIDFDGCSNTVTITGPAPCGDFVLTGGGTGTSCAEYTITLNLCAMGNPSGDAPVASIGTCTGMTPNDDGTITISNLVGVDRVEIVESATFSGGQGFASATPVMGTSHTFSGLSHNTTYSIRLYGGNDNCTTDVNGVMVPAIDCNMPMGDCDCRDYIYLNDVEIDAVEKFQIDPTTGALTEIGSPWLTPGTITDPHGLAIDINGFIYVGEPGGVAGGGTTDLTFTGGSIYQLTCDGTVENNDFVPTLENWATNWGEDNNTVYIPNSVDETIDAFSLCDGSLLGSMFVRDGGGDIFTWGFYIEDGMWFMPEALSGNIYSGSTDVSLYTSPPTNSGALLFNTGVVPNGTDYIPMGLTRDSDGNFFLVTNQIGGNGSLVEIRKYDSNGNFINLIMDNVPSVNAADGQSGFYGARGIVYSESSNLLYVGAFDNCITVFDTDLVEQTMLNVGNPLNTEAKGIGIVTECCPNDDLTLMETICSTGNGEIIFLQEILNCGDGTICEGQWSVETPNGNQVFNDCNLSITVNGTGCATYVLEKTTPATGVQQCGMFRIELTICTEVPSAVLSTAEGTCTDDTPNDDAVIDITMAMNVDQANISVGSTYTGPDYNGMGAVNISGTTGQITGLMHNTEYTVRLFNGSNDCFADQTVTTPDIVCEVCTCTEYVYLNETTNGGRVHKYAIDVSDGSLQEVLNTGGTTWYPGQTTSELPNPHGLGVDLNGFLYIGSNFFDPNASIRRLDCGGNIFDAADFDIDIPDGALNILTIENTIYANIFNSQGDTRIISAFDVCTQSLINTACLNGSAGGFLDWGFFYDERTGFFYSNEEGANSPLWRYTVDDFGTGVCVDPFLTAGDGTLVAGEQETPGSVLFGITTDEDGNIYMVANAEGAPGRLVKYDSTGAFITASDIDDQENGVGYFSARGIVYSENAQRLYVSTTSTVDDCLSIFDRDLNYLMAGVPPTGDLGQGNPLFGRAKGVSINTECCPNEDLSFFETVCSAGNGERIFLQELFSCGDGVVCEGQWRVAMGNANQIFNDCDLSITVNGSGCATYILEKPAGALGAEQCGPFTIMLEVCTEVPSAVLSTAEGSCTGADANEDAVINISMAVNANQANFSVGTPYSGPDYNGAGAVTISGGTGQITGLLHNTEYTVRIFNGSNECFADQTITTADIECCPEDNCADIQIIRD